MKNKKTIKKIKKNKTRRGGTNRGENVVNPMHANFYESTYANNSGTNNLFNTLKHIKQTEYLNKLNNNDIIEILEMAEDEIHNPNREYSIMTGKSNKELHHIIKIALNILNTRKSL
jgi:hypothetical protein